MIGQARGEMGQSFVGFFAKRFVIGHLRQAFEQCYRDERPFRCDGIGPLLLNVEGDTCIRENGIAQMARLFEHKGADPKACLPGFFL